MWLCWLSWWALRLFDRMGCVCCHRLLIKFSRDKGSRMLWDRTGTFSETISFLVFAARLLDKKVWGRLEKKSWHSSVSSSFSNFLSGIRKKNIYIYPLGNFYWLLFTEIKIGEIAPSQVVTETRKPAEFLLVSNKTHLSGVWGTAFAKTRTDLFRGDRNP